MELINNNKDYYKRLIDRSSPTPLYLQVSQIIEQMIEAKQFEPGERIWSEENFADLFGVSRPTINKAIDCLIDKRILKKDKGKGTFIEIEDKSKMIEVNEIESYKKYIGHEVENVVLFFGEGIADANIAESLEIQKNLPVVILKRLRIVDKAPLCLSQVYLKMELYQSLKSIDFRQNFLHQTLREKLGINIIKLKRNISVSRSTLEDVRYLETNRGNPILELKSVGFDQNNEPALYQMARFDADRVVLQGIAWRTEPEKQNKSFPVIF
jgi:GntR family transcriptional regulator